MIWRFFVRNIRFWLQIVSTILHWTSYCLVRVACLWSKMPMFQKAGMREGGFPLPPAFQYLILMTWRACNLHLVMVSSLASKWQFQLFYEMKLKTSKFKVMAFWGQWRYRGDIMTKFKSQAVHVIRIKYWKACGSCNCQPSLPHSYPLEHRHFMIPFYFINRRRGQNILTTSVSSISKTICQRCQGKFIGRIFLQKRGNAWRQRRKNMVVSHTLNIETILFLKNWKKDIAAEGN